MLSKFLNKVTQGDCEVLLKQLPDASVDMCLTSPPYDDLRTYKGFKFDVEVIARQLFRILKPGGVVVWVVGDATKNGSETGTSFKQALCFKEVGFNFYDTMIYRKVNYLPLTHRRYEQAFEYMFVFSKAIPKSFNPITVRTLNAGSKFRGQFFTPSSTKTTARHTLKKIASTRLASNIFSYVVGSEQHAVEKSRLFRAELDPADYACTATLYVRLEDNIYGLGTYKGNLDFTLLFPDIEKKKLRCAFKNLVYVKSHLTVTVRSKI